MNKKYGTMLMAFGLFIVAISLVTAQDIHLLAIGDVAHSWPCESLSGEWNYLYCTYGDLSLSIDRVQGSYSLQNVVNDYASYLVMGADGQDWSAESELHFSMKLSLISGVEIRVSVNTFDGSGSSVPATFILSVPSDIGWVDYTVDLTSPDSGSIYLNRVHYVTFFYNVQGRAATQLIDNIYTVYTGTPSPTPTPTPSSSPSPTPTPSATPTPAPGETPAPSASPNGTEPTPEPTLQPGATPTPAPSFGTDDLNRMGVFAGLGMFATGAVISFTGRKRK